MMIELDHTGTPVDLDEVGEQWLLQLAEHTEVEARRAERSKLRLAHRWCLLHPAATDADAATWGDLGGRERDCDLRLGGEGTPGVAAYTAEPFAAALGISTRAGMGLLADALELVGRLPRIWERVEALQVPPWRARRVAQATTGLSPAAAAHVDAALAPILGSAGPTRIDRAVEEARARFDVAEQAVEEDTQTTGWGVRLVPSPFGRYAGTSLLEIIGDTPTLTRLHDLITTTAHHLLDPQHPTGSSAEDLEQRKIRALAQITDHATGATGATSTTAPGRGAGSGRSTKLYLHLDGSSLLDPTTGLGHAERLGPLTSGLIHRWLGQTRATILPVLHADRTDAVDTHDPPAWMRELVILRDRRCVFPHCDRPSRSCDLDHIEAYVEMDDGGPPGQTRPDNLAPLCRGHHRAKTFAGWTYQHNPDDTYTWHTPHGHHYQVHPDGSVSVPAP